MGKVSQLEGERFPNLRGKCSPVRGMEIELLLDGETFPCERGKHFSVRGENVSLLDGETFYC